LFLGTPGESPMGKDKKNNMESRKQKKPKIGKPKSHR